MWLLFMKVSAHKKSTERLDYVPNQDEEIRLLFDSFKELYQDKWELNLDLKNGEDSHPFLLHHICDRLDGGVHVISCEII